MKCIGRGLEVQEMQKSGSLLIFGFFHDREFFVMTEISGSMS